MTHHHLDWRPEHLFSGLLRRDHPGRAGNRQRRRGDARLPAPARDRGPAAGPRQGPARPPRGVGSARREDGPGAALHDRLRLRARREEPGDVLQVDTLRGHAHAGLGLHRDHALPRGAADEFADYQHLHIAIDRNAGTCTVHSGIHPCRSTRSSASWAWPRPRPGAASARLSPGRMAGTWTTRNSAPARRSTFPSSRRRPSSLPATATARRATAGRSSSPRWRPRCAAASA